jgi:phosphate transport system permease protein
MRLNQPINAVPLDIFYDATSPYAYLHRQAQAGAIILVALILILSLVTRFVTRNKFSEG